MRAVATRQRKPAESDREPEDNPSSRQGPGSATDDRPSSRRGLCSATDELRKSRQSLRGAMAYSRPRCRANWTAAWKSPSMKASKRPSAPRSSAVLMRARRRRSAPVNTGGTEGAGNARAPSRGVSRAAGSSRGVRRARCAGRPLPSDVAGCPDGRGRFLGVVHHLGVAPVALGSSRGRALASVPARAGSLHAVLASAPARAGSSRAALASAPARAGGSGTNRPLREGAHGDAWRAAAIGWATVWPTTLVRAAPARAGGCAPTNVREDRLIGRPSATSPTDPRAGSRGYPTMARPNARDAKEGEGQDLRPNDGGGRAHPAHTSPQHAEPIHQPHPSAQDNPKTSDQYRRALGPRREQQNEHPCYQFT